MASNTPRLGLYKKDPIADANDTFNIQTMLNDNWDRIDQNVETITGAQAKANQAEQNAKNYADQKVSAISFPVQSVNNKTGAVTLTASDVGASPTGHTHTFAEITSKPTTLSGYGITDAIPTSQKGAANGVASLDGGAKVPTTQLPAASTTQAGIVQLNDTLTSTSTTQAATANAVKQVNDALAAHSADTVKHITAAERTAWNSIRQKHQVTADDGSAINISGQDLNNIKMTGIYMGDNLTNAPIPKAAGNWCYIEVIRRNDTYIIQKAYKLNSGQNSLYMRRCEAGTWSAWSEDLFTSVSDGKAQLKTAITSKGGTVSQAGAVPTFAELVSGVNSISTGKRYATGTYSSSTIWNSMSVNNLNFRPRVIIIRSNAINYAKQYVYSDVDNTGFNRLGLQYSPNQLAAIPTWTINSNGFTVSFDENQQLNIIYTWEAYE